jgi:hypothetical protein
LIHIALSKPFFCHVVHKGALRHFLSVCKHFSIYRADVKAEFLRADLKEKIYVRAPPGHAFTAPLREEGILGLSKATCGFLQQSFDSCYPVETFFVMLFTRARYGISFLFVLPKICPFVELMSMRNFNELTSRRKLMSEPLQGMLLRSL